MSVKFIQEIAIKKAGVPGDWRPFEIEMGRDIPGSNVPPGMYRCVGAICTIGADGLPDWPKTKKAMKFLATVWISEEELSSYVSAWEEETGQCSKCLGSGQQWNGWSMLAGTKFKTCTKCGGSGKSEAIVTAPEPRANPDEIQPEAARR